VTAPSTDTSLPDPLLGDEPHSFVHHTITVRWPRIAQQVIADNEYPIDVNRRIQTLIDDIPETPIRPLDDPGAPDEALWNERLAPYEGMGWLECPWFIGETYFYRRLMEATGYFQDGATRHDDPFTTQKHKGYVESVEAIRTLARVRAHADDEDPRAVLTRLLSVALWGNQADLSLWAADAEGPDHLSSGDEDEHVLADDTTAVLDHLSGLGRPARIDMWADNAGFELITDLALIDGLLATGVADPVVLHPKAHPTFVSDATIDDVHDALDRCAADEDEAVQALSERLRRALRDGRLRLQDELAWTSPLRARELPATVNAELARADLVISKGDANYRRLLGDREWPSTTPFGEVVDYFPAPLLALRTLKAETVAGLEPDQVERLEQVDPDWMVNGRWGLLQFAPA
jgi:uncharacterized protein with ATP-grasp and redox domains